MWGYVQCAGGDARNQGLGHCYGFTKNYERLIDLKSPEGAFKR